MFPRYYLVKYLLAGTRIWSGLVQNEQDKLRRSLFLDIVFVPIRFWLIIYWQIYKRTHHLCVQWVICVISVVSEKVHNSDSLISVIMSMVQEECTLRSNRHSLLNSATITETLWISSAIVINRLVFYKMKSFFWKTKLYLGEYVSWEFDTGSNQL